MVYVTTPSPPAPLLVVSLPLHQGKFPCLHAVRCKQCYKVLANLIGLTTDMEKQETSGWPTVFKLYIMDFAVFMFYQFILTDTLVIVL